MQKLLLFSFLFLTVNAASAQVQKSNPLKVVKHWSPQTRSILHSQSAQQKTTAAHERIQANAMFIATNGVDLELYDSTRFFNSSDRGSKFNFTDMYYSSDEGDLNVLFDSTLHYTNNGTDFALTDANRVVYNNNIRQVFTERVVNTGTTLDNDFEYRYTYNSNGTHNVTYQFRWNTSTKTWDSLAKTVYVYNTAGKVTEENSYDKNGSSWDFSYRNVYTYDGAGNMASSNFSTWNGSAWEPVNKELYTYYNTSKLATSVFQTYQGGTWENLSRDSFDYNGTDFYTYNKSQDWSKAGNAWVNSSLETRHLKSGLPDSLYNYSWDTTAKAWQSDGKLVWQYNASGNPTLADGYFVLGGMDFHILQYKFYYETYFDVSVNNIQPNVAATIFPNPATDNITIAWKEKPVAKQISVSVINSAGQVVVKTNMELQNKNSISLSGLQPGLYWIAATNETGEVLLKQSVIKQ